MSNFLIFLTHLTYGLFHSMSLFPALSIARHVVGGLLPHRGSFLLTVTICVSEHLFTRDFLPPSSDKLVLQTNYSKA